MARVAAGEKIAAVALDVRLSGQTICRIMRAAGYRSRQRTVWIQSANPTPTPET